MKYLEERDDFDMSRIGMFGEASGGTIALLAALDPVHVLPQLTQTKLRLQQTEWDPRSTPAVSSNHIAAALPSTATLIRHINVRDNTEKAGINSRMLDWIEETLSDRRLH
jgi:hypothetical protein